MGSFCWANSLSKNDSKVREAVRAQKCLKRLLPSLSFQGLPEEASPLLLGTAVNRDKALISETTTPKKRHNKWRHSWELRWRTSGNLMFDFSSALCYLFWRWMSLPLALAFPLQKWQYKLTQASIKQFRQGTITCKIHSKVQSHLLWLSLLKN